MTKRGTLPTNWAVMSLGMAMLFGGLGTMMIFG
jgi:hypothetical protein